jgi:hypothetical protein
MLVKEIIQKKVSLQDVLLKASTELDKSSNLPSWLGWTIISLAQAFNTPMPVPMPVAGNSVQLTEQIDRLQSALLNLKMVNRAAEAPIESSLKAAKACLL